MIFRTGSVLIVGKCKEESLYNVFNYLKNILQEEYNEIKQNCHKIDNVVKIKKKQIKKKKKKNIKKKKIIKNYTFLKNN